jgi:pimeloyl-ACP methyl ester carboxylesterase
VLASVAPYRAEGLDWFAGMGQDNITEFSAALAGREVMQQFVEAATPDMMALDVKTLVQAFSSLLCPADAAELTEAYGEFALSRIRGGIQASPEGWVDDDIAFTTSWGFELDRIRVPVLLLHGEQDHAVPFAHGKWLAAHIPNVEARLLPDDGHLTLFTRRIPDVHAWLLGQWSNA